MTYWLLKSEPSSYSWDQLVADGRTHWDGVRNAQALNNLRAMQPGDRAFFYHSNEGKEIVGVVEVIKAFYPDSADKSGKLGMIDIRPLMPPPTAVGLPAMRANPELSGLSLAQAIAAVGLSRYRSGMDHCCVIWLEFPSDTCKI